jgi:hypothetical protein
MGITGVESQGSRIYELTVTRDDIIRAAMRKIGLLKKDQEPSKAEYDNASLALNGMIRAWQNEGIALWKNKDATLYLNTATVVYSLGDTGDHFTIGAVETETAAAASTGDTSITVDSISDIADNDHIGIELDDGSLQWTNVNGTPSGTTVTFDDELTDDVSVDAHVYVYTTKAQRPIEIIEARLRNDDDTDVPIDFLSREEYMRMSDKSSDGTPTGIYYDPQIPLGKLYVYNAVTDVSHRLKMTVKYPLQIFDAGDDDADFPAEWTNALIYNLAVELAPEKPEELDGRKMEIVFTKAADYKANAFISDRDAQYIVFGPRM